MDRLIKGHQRV